MNTQLLSAGLNTIQTSLISNQQQSSSTGRGESYNNSTQFGSFSVTILSAYDLPAVEQPLSVSLSCSSLNATVRDANNVRDHPVSTTGPPMARHKDRNSFKFPPNQPLIWKAPLPELYVSNATLTVQYRLSEKNLSASIALRTLTIRQPTWLILNLTPSAEDNKGGAETPSQQQATSDDAVLPTLRVQVELNGPYRPEIDSLLKLGNAWFNMVDFAQGSINGLVQSLPQLPDTKFLLLPAVPVATLLVVISPIAVGILILGLPFFLPLVVVVFTALLGSSGFLIFLYASTANGRESFHTLLQPLVQTILSTSSGQRMIYETGPRPSPVGVARTLLPKDIWGKFLISLVIDLVGSCSYLLPIVGEGFDVAWAPMQTVLLMAMYDTVSPNLKYISFAEEILPFTDIVPSATIGWLTEFGPSIIKGIPPKPPSAAHINTTTLLSPSRS
jgi:hypothetical protein